MQNVLTRSQSLTPPSTSSQTASDVNTVSKPDELLSPMDILKKSVKQIKEGLQVILFHSCSVQTLLAIAHVTSKHE
jgi:hypothetical protein